MLKKIFLGLAIVVMFASVSFAQCVNCPKYQVQPEYTLVPPVYAYLYQPPPVVVNVVPAPSFWVKTTRHPHRPLLNLFKPWQPVYTVPPVVTPIAPPNVSVQAPGVSVEVK